MTNLPTRQGESAPAGEHAADEQAVIKAAGGWINLLARTLKTSRLYETGNPTSARFRQELGLALGLLLERHGSMTFKITADDLLMGDVSLYPAKSREDNLALPFYRDGIHAITFHPGIEPRESDAFLDALLKVTGTSEGDDDLVTLLWEAQLDHIEMEYVPAESDLALGGPQEPATSPVPWPKGEDGTTETDTAEAPVDGGEGSRSDDWSTGDLTIEIEAAFAELEALTATEGEAYLERHRREQQMPLVETAIAIANACLSTPVTQADMDDLARFLPRALRRAVSEGEWRWAAETLHVLDRCQSREWSVETFAQEVMQPASVTAAIELVDAQDEDVVLEFITFAKALGEPAVDLLNLVMSESKVRRTRRLDDRRDRPLVAFALDEQDRVGLVGDLLVRQYAQPLVVQPAVVVSTIFASQMADDDHMEAGLLQLGQAGVDRLHVAVDRGVFVVADAGLAIGLGASTALGVGAHGLKHLGDRVEHDGVAGLAELANLFHRLDEHAQRERLQHLDAPVYARLAGQVLRGALGIEHPERSAAPGAAGEVRLAGAGLPSQDVEAAGL